MPESNDQLIEDFYVAFARRDGEAMAAAYAPAAHFEDAVFTDLNGKEPGQMWRMLTSRAKDLEIELAEHSAHGNVGAARWIATYTFAQTGRRVVNDVSASFEFENGKIVEHHDKFDFYKWSQQALGTPGLLLGWTALLRKKVQSQARAGLDEFIAAESARA